MNQTISLKISFPELEKEIFYNFPRNITAGQLLEILVQQGIIADRRLLAEYHIFVPWSGIWLNKQRLIDSYALVEEEPLELWAKPTFPKDFILIHVPDLEITEKIAFFPNFTNGRGAIQALEAKERLNIEMYGLYDPEKGAWIEINEPLTNYGFVNGSCLEYVMYSEEVADARKRAFQAKQQQKQQLEMHSRQSSGGGQAPLSPRASDAKYRRPTASLHVTAPFFQNKTLLSFSTSDTAAGVVSKVKWFGNQQSDTQGYDVRVMYRDGSSNAMDDLSPLSFYETNFAGEPYICLELVPNGTVVSPASPRESPRQPQSNGPATIGTYNAVQQPIEHHNTPYQNSALSRSQPASQPTMINHSVNHTPRESNTSSPMLSPLNSPVNHRVAELQGQSTSTGSPSGSSASTPYGSPMSNGTMSPKSNPGTPEIGRASVSTGENIMLKIEVPNLQIGKMIKCTWTDTPQDILTKLREKKVFVDDSYTLVIPKNKKMKLNTIILDSNSPLSSYRSTGRIKASEALYLLDEKEAQKLKDKGGYEGGPTGQKVPKRGSISNVINKIKHTLPVVKKGSISVTSNKVEEKAPTDVVIPYKFPVLKQLVDFLETRAFMDEGIFRISSNMDLINQYYPILASLPDISKMKNHDVASLLKKYLRDMPESLIPRSRFDTFVEAQKATSSDERTKGLRNAISSLPEDNKNGLKILFKLLNKIHENSSSNKMTSSNLAIIFGPILLRSSSEDSVAAMVSSTQFQTNVVQTMIVNYNILFEVAEVSKFTNIFRTSDSGSTSNNAPNKPGNSAMHSVPEESMNSTHNAATAQILNSYNNMYNVNGGNMSTLAPNANAVPTNVTGPAIEPTNFDDFDDNAMSNTFGMHLNEETLNPFNDVPFDNPFDDIPTNSPGQTRSPKGSASGQSGYNTSQGRSPKGSASGFDQGQKRSPNGSASGQPNGMSNTGTLRSGLTNILSGGNTQQTNYFNINSSNNNTMNGTSPRNTNQQPQYSTSPPKTSGFAQSMQAPQLSSSPPKNQVWGQPHLTINTNPPPRQQPEPVQPATQNNYSNGPISPRQQPEPMSPKGGQPTSPRPGLQSAVSQPKLGHNKMQSNSLAPPTSPRRGNSTTALNSNNNTAPQQPSTPLFDNTAPLSRPALGTAGPKRAAMPVKRLDIPTPAPEPTSTGSTSPSQTSPRSYPGPIGRDGSQYNPTPRPVPTTANGAPPKGYVKANPTPTAPPRNASPSMGSRSGEVGDLAVVVSALLSGSAPPHVKTQYAVKLANYLATDGDYVRNYLKDKVGIDNAIKLIESLATVIKARN
eukprot:TRINITY_DN1442_c0_g1_i1.p1 TRINITY_DN1442_c0_g1~~TRINITY_DN1442_c0_g1_i1.p1  ORF type:complete len:1300 (-),score=300.12 TRINITY_DN1442_c0_g1_i1:109-4008(-)